MKLSIDGGGGLFDGVTHVQSPVVGDQRILLSQVLKGSSLLALCQMYLNFM